MQCVKMALFEKKKATKLMLDDTVPLTAVIEAAQNMETHIDYVIRVQRGPATENCWQINRRYSDFSTLHDNLKISGIPLPLPPKKVFGNMEREFVAERQRALQQYLNTILANLMLANSLFVKQFLDINNYSPNFHEIALQHVSMFFRSEPHWEVVEPLKDAGWRIRKHYFLIKPKEQPKVRQVLAWSDFGPDKFLSDKDLQAILKILPTVQHPFIYPVTFATASENGGFAIRTFHATGTLRDFLCKAKPKASYLKKYGKPKAYTEFNLMNIKTYGRQILEALKFLHDKGIPYGHLHLSNVMLEGNTCRLLDLENSFIGLPSFYRQYFTQFKKINTTEAIDIYCFGHLLYEMVFGEPLNSSTKDDFPAHLPPPVKAVLESLLTTESCKTGLPTVDDLIADPLFSDVQVVNSEFRPQLKIPSKLKDVVKTAKEKIEKRLQDEQKVISSYRRLSKAQAFHRSDEEKKKRKKSSRKRLSQQQLTEENGLEENGAISPAGSESGSSTSARAASPAARPTSPADSKVA
ncbi:PX domain-containing protein kinase-like protein isoform X2 [Ptychodera flava]|uniref:PX domain-containing protein kinase-like protein isoform X2 n=1 Tax=Ptychodera flava TaxID=63121 RepID=UPI00396A5BAB